MHRLPQIIESPRTGGAFALINTALSRDGISYEQRVVAEPERLVQTAETTASYCRT